MDDKGGRSSAAALSVAGLCKRYGATEAICGVTFRSSGSSVRMAPAKRPHWNVFSAPAAVQRPTALMRPYASRPDAHFYLGLAPDARGDRQEAVARFQTVLKNNPDDSNLYYKLGNSNSATYSASIRTMRPRTLLWASHICKPRESMRPSRVSVTGRASS